MIAAPASGFHGPVKRSITIAGHQTSISLEPIFWQALEAAATRLSLPLSALVAEIDAVRILAADPPNLASALRTWLFAQHAVIISRNSIDSANGSQ
ncbi:ribbon-helix-helix domain-containing protein [Sphingomonas sp. 4RDLI-65]